MNTPKDLLSVSDYFLYENTDYDLRTKLLHDALKKNPDYEVWVPMHYWRHTRTNSVPSKIYYHFDNILISNKGNVYNTETNVYPKINTKENGYFRFHVGGTFFILHRAVACNFNPIPDNLIGTPITKLQANHLNGIKSDSSFTNLEWATPKQNMNHAFTNGLIVIGKGKDNGNVKPLLGTVCGYEGYNGTKFIALGKEDIHAFNMKEAGAVARGNQATCNGCTFTFAEESDLTIYPNITNLSMELLLKFKEEKVSIIKGVNKLTGEEFEFKGKQPLLDMGFDPSSVYKCVKGKLSHHKGFRFFH